MLPWIEVPHIAVLIKILLARGLTTFQDWGGVMSALRGLARPFGALDVLDGLVRRLSDDHGMLAFFAMDLHELVPYISAGTTTALVERLDTVEDEEVRELWPGSRGAVQAARRAKAAEDALERSEPLLTPGAVDAEFIRTIEAGQDLTGLSMRGARLAGRKLVGCDFTGVDLTGADLRGANLTGAVLFRATLAGAVLDRAGLSNAMCSGADLRGASLYAVDACSASFIEADLRGANLTAARCRSVNFRNADLRGARTDGLDVLSASLAGASVDFGFPTCG